MLWLSSGFPAIVALLCFVSVFSWAMSEGAPEPFVAEKDEFVLDKTGNASQMKQRLAFLINKHGALANVDEIIRRDNPTVVYSVIPQNEKNKTTYHVYRVSRQKFIYIDIYGVSLSTQNGNIIDFNCMKGRR